MPKLERYKFHMNNNMFDGILVFCAVVDNQGFAAAARSLGHTPSHISKEIARLEARLGTRLLNRTTRSLNLTEEGQRYYNSVRPLVDDVKQAENKLQQRVNIPGGMLKISIPVSFAQSCLNDWLPEFLDAYPDIRLTIEASDRKVDVIEEGFDVVIRAGRLDDSNLVARKLANSRLMTLAAPHYLEKYGCPQHPEDLSSQTTIDFSFRQLGQGWQYNLGNGKSITVNVVPRVNCNSAETEEALAVAGVGITRLPSFACQKSLDSGALVAILEAFDEPAIGIYAIYPSRSHLSLKVRVFVDFLVAKMG